MRTKSARKSRPRRRKPPYIKKLSERNGISIWLVDGSYIRTNEDEEFSNYGHHYGYPYIPKGEFWIDQGVDPEEQKFYRRHLFTEYRLREKGVADDVARKRADAAEERLRLRAGDVRKVKRKGHLADPNQVHKRLWKKLEGPLNVWIVDGRLVRSVFDDDFTEGGHEHVYEYVPENELWIDNTVRPHERPYVLLHELHERNLMEKGWDYDRAHDDSSKLEHRLRKHPQDLHDALANEGWE